MSQLFTRILEMSISGGILLLILMMLRPLIKKAPAWVFPLIWEIAALKLLIPFSFNVNPGFFKSQEIIRTKVMYYYVPDISKILSQTAADTADKISENIGAVPQNAVTAGTGRWILIAAVIWTAGVILMLTYMIVSYLMLRKRLKGARLLKENIYTDKTVTSPFVFGLLKPSIYVPEHEMAGLEAIIRHEKAHIERRDNIVKMLGFAVLSVHWFNPSVWAAFHLLSEDMELACDERALRNMSDTEKADYSEILLNQVRKNSVSSLSPVAFSETGLKPRIRRILTVKKTVRALGISAIACTLALTSCFFAKENISQSETSAKYRYTWVKEYVPGQEGIIGNTDAEKLRKISMDFDIGATEEGVPVFKDPAKAFNTIKRLYKDEIEKTKEVYNLPRFGESTMLTYKALAWQTVPAEDANYSRFVDLLSLLDIYENSFDISDIINAPDITLHKKYVTTANLYLNPLSSFIPHNGDSMEDYFVDGDTFTIKHRVNGNEKVIRNVKWTWKSIPWTEAEWKKMFVMAKNRFTIHPSYDRYLKLDDEYCILSVGGIAYLTRINNTGIDGPFIWSIYRIEPADQ